VALPAAVLARYAGRYELAPGFVLTVTPAASGLTVQATGQPPLHAHATADNAFRVAEVDASLSFIQGENGAISSVVLHQNGRDVPGKKLMD
jgi:hypothetical protein